MQRTSGLYRLTQIPKVYEAFQEILAGSSMRARLVREFLQPRPGERILDIGCGSAAVLPYLGDVRYHGIDANPDHIAQARERHGARGTFSVGDIAAAAALQEGAYDSVYSIGVYHHLDDDRLD
jgi:cyclopropane fatty-acyl-phospholipid synthase-like methyltransferase